MLVNLLSPKEKKEEEGEVGEKEEKRKKPSPKHVPFTDFYAVHALTTANFQPPA